jgi:topoisomerase-4 subunit A
MSDQATLFPPEVPELPDDALTLGDYAERAYLDYAISVVKGRALPEVADGQKPVQRRILHAMNLLGLGADAKPRKSAAVVGDVLGKLHPHGDQSVYDALVRMAQNFSLRYPLIDGQGNFGSRDGDGAAAMRYTEARLTPIARLLLDEIDEGTVDFGPNYDGSTEEPELLPARLPFVLLNGASGIAVGMATEIPSHHLAEVAAAAVAMIRSNGKATTAELLEHIKGPDFPGGAQIISSSQEIAAIYESGRGSVKLRARWTIEELARGQWQVVVNELPPNTSSQKVLEEIEELTNPKIRLGKKALSAEQVASRQTILASLDGVRDESGRDVPVRLVFEPKSRNVEQAAFIHMLLAQTSLEASVPLNLVMIGIDGRPRQKPLADILREWAEFRQTCITRRTQHRLNKVDERIHILEGRSIVLLNIDKVIRIIRESDVPKPALIEAFKLSDRQAEDILEIRLRQLARLEAIKIEQELTERRADKSKLEELLGNPASLKRQMIREIEADAKTFGAKDPRRTLIQEERRASLAIKVVDEAVTVVVSEKGWVRARVGHELDPTLFTFKPGDGLLASYECRSVDQLVVLGTNGRAYSAIVSSLPTTRALRGDKSEAVPLTSLFDFEPGTHVASTLAGPIEQPLLIATSAGHGFVCKLGDLVGRNRGGKGFVTLGSDDAEEGDARTRTATEAPRPLPMIAVDVATDNEIACLSSDGYLLVFPASEIKKLSDGGRGITLQDIGVGAQLASALPIGAKGLVVVGKGRGGKEQRVRMTEAALEPHRGKRARKGRKLAARLQSPMLVKPDGTGSTRNDG